MAVRKGADLEELVRAYFARQERLQYKQGFLGVLAVPKRVRVEKDGAVSVGFLVDDGSAFAEVDQRGRLGCRNF
jgi:hypothetical protein